MGFQDKYAKGIAGSVKKLVPAKTKTK